MPTTVGQMEDRLAANFRKLRTSEVRRMIIFSGTSVHGTKIAGAHAGDLRTHTAVIIQHWVQ